MERRSSSRQKAFLQGRLYFNNRRNSVDCLIRDLSEQGAKLRFSSTIATPEVVELHIPNRDESYRARVEWRNGEEVGVSFNYEESAPSLARGAAPADLPARVQKLEQDLASLTRKFNELQVALRQITGGEM
jgi:hypothetical protein